MYASLSDSSADFAAIPSQLSNLINDYTPLLQQINEDSFSHKPAAGKWSKKEILGHLIDSAQNNLRRFIVVQYEKEPPHIVYDQEFWVAANDYQSVPSNELILLWKLMNERIVQVLTCIPSAQLEKTCNTGRETDDFLSLRFIAADYVGHLQHHLRQIFPQTTD